MRARFMPVLFVSVLSVAIAACASDEERSPELRPSADLTRLLTCDALRAQQLSPNETGQFWVPGGFAQCLAEGQYCPASWLANRCDAGQATAKCTGGTWRWLCVETEGGTLDAASGG